MSSGGSCIVVDSAGNAYVTGTVSSSGINTNFLVLKCDPDGRLVWAKTHAGPRGEGDESRAMALDAEDNVYVMGFITNAESRHSLDFATLKYDKNGKQLWVKTYNGPGNGYDLARSIVVDKAGNAYIMGESFGRGGQADIATVKYASDGEEIWVKRYNGPGNQEDQAQAIAVDSAGNVYVTGRSKGAGTGWDIATIKY